MLANLPYRWSAFLIALALLAPVAAGQAMVQLSFEDGAQEKAGANQVPGPIRVELEIGALVRDEPRQVRLAFQLAHGTTAADLTELVSTRLSRADFDVLAPAPDRSRTSTRGTLFITDTLFVNLRILGPIVGVLTTSDGPPQTLRLQPPSGLSLPGTLVLIGSTKHPRKKALNPFRITVELVEGDHPAQIAERLHAASMKVNLLSERPGGDAWQPVRTKTGDLVQGISASIAGGGDWRLELVLPRRR